MIHIEKTLGFQECRSDIFADVPIGTGGRPTPLAIGRVDVHKVALTSQHFGSKTFVVELN